MLTDLLASSNIKLKVNAQDWQDAIRKGGELLVSSGIAEERYIDAMIDAVEQLGPYIVLIPGVAMPHARGESGVIKNGLSLITLQNPVDFLDSENNPVNLVVCLAAENNSSHLSAIKNLAQFLDSQENISAVVNADEVEQVMEIIKKY